MALQTHRLRDGAWVTETVSFQTVHQRQTVASEGPRKPAMVKPPHYGLLTQTVVESPLVSSILPVKIRSAHNDDIAWIGEHFVEIREFQQDEHEPRLQAVARKNDFGARIRNAAVVGSGEAVIKQEDEERPLLMGPPTPNTTPDPLTPALPPELLLLALDNGDCVFLFLRLRSDGTPEFVASRFQNPKGTFLPPGFHMTVDPTSRYMALGCAENFFAVYELESHTTLEDRYRRGLPLHPVRSYQGRGLRGVIHKMVFLYPGTEPSGHVILLLIVVQDGKSRMVLYEWALGEDLQLVLAQEKNGHQMPLDNRMPLLVVPLMVQSSFMAVSSDHIAVCSQTLQGQPTFSDFEMEPHAATANHHGLGEPLWTAWARPFRLREHWRGGNDCLYLAREDGVVEYIEADQEDSGEVSLRSTIVMDKFDTNISAAFACFPDQWGDILVMGGDSCLGGLWRCNARKPPALLIALPNWSPTVDWIATQEPTDEVQQIGAHAQALDRPVSMWLAKPDRLFATSGRGTKGAITEFRNGLEASIMVDIAYESTARKTWLFPAHVTDPSHGFYMLVSMPDQSSILHLSRDLVQVNVPNQGTVPFDLSSRTLFATRTMNHVAIQVTEKSVTVVSRETSAQFTFAEMLPELSVDSSPLFSVSDAFVAERTIAVAFHIDTRFQIRIFQLDDTCLVLNRARTFESIEGEVTCLALSATHGLLAGLWHDDQPWLVQCALGDEGAKPNTLRLHHVLAGAHALDSICSIVSFPQVTMLGMRSGEVVSLTDCPESGNLGRATPRITHFGVSKVSITPAVTYLDGEPAVLISCGGHLVLWSPSNPPGSGFGEAADKKQQIWPVEPATFQGPRVHVDFAVAIDLGKDCLSTVSSSTLPRDSSLASSLLILSGHRIIIARLQRQQGMVPRHIPANGTPSRIIYSETLRCCIVAVTRQTRPTLLFMDPNTGEELARPTDKEGNSVDFVTGLGQEGDRILGLADWKYYKDKNWWYFVLVTTKAGRLLVISVESLREASTADDDGCTFRYWTRFKKPVNRPVYSVLAMDEELMYCVGSTLYVDKMDTIHKKLKSVYSVELGSPASSLQRVNGHIFALTAQNSLKIIRPPRMGETTSQEPSGIRHADTRTRKTLDMVEIGVATQPEQAPSSIVLIATQGCQIAGLWVPWQVAQQDCKTLLQAQQLPASIRKFCRARTRPAWSRSAGGREPRYGRLLSTGQDAELLGMSLDGSVQHLTLLSPEGWRFLRFVQNLAQRDRRICPFTYDDNKNNNNNDDDDDDDDDDDEDDSDDDDDDDTGGASHMPPGAFWHPEPVERSSEMHVNGDILQRCLDMGALESLVAAGSHEARFVQLLDELDAAAAMRVLDAGNQANAYYQMGYDVLRYYLAPVF